MTAASDFILASSSPRRKQILEWMGYHFTIAAANIDETPFPDEKPVDYVSRAALTKAMALNGNNPGVVLAADTIVVDGAQILGKPVDILDATRILQQLRNRTHQVFSALTVFNTNTKQTVSQICVSDVPMRNYSDAEIEEYIRSGDAADKAGAYAIQNELFHPVIHFQDCYANVMGLPLCHTWLSLRKEGICVSVLPHQICLSRLGYDCPLWRQYLQGVVNC